MKKALLFVSIFSIFLAVACTSKTNTTQAVTPVITDTTGLAAFQEWKFQNERMEASAYAQQTSVASTPVIRKKAAVKKAVVKQPATPVQTETTDQNTDGSGTMGTETTNQAKEKKGISNTAKGTVIGAVSGAVLGAVINKKNRVVGGILGGVLGGGIGFGIGKKIDKKQEENL